MSDDRSADLAHLDHLLRASQMYLEDALDAITNLEIPDPHLKGAMVAALAAIKGHRRVFKLEYIKRDVPEVEA